MILENCRTQDMDWADPAPDGSGENPLHHMARHIREVIIAAVVTVGQLFVVEAQQMQNRGMEAMHMNLVAGHANASVVGFAI